MEEESKTLQDLTNKSIKTPQEGQNGAVPQSAFVIGDEEEDSATPAASTVVVIFLTLPPNLWL